MRDISLHIMDIAQNSITAGASAVDMSISSDEDGDTLQVRISDNGKGMREDDLDSVTDPFYTTRTTRRVGLGVPLLKASAERAGGSFSIGSVLGKGTAVCASFRISNIDRIPLGNVAQTVAQLAAATAEVDFRLELASRKGRFLFDTVDIRKKIEGIPINDFAVVKWMEEFIQEGVDTIFGGVLDEISG